MEQFFFLISLAIVFISWLATVLAMLNVYYIWPLIIIMLLITGLLVLLLWNLSKKVQKPTKLDLLILIIAIFFAGFNTFYFHNNFAGGRDEGYLNFSAVQLVKNHSTKIFNWTNMPAWRMKDNYFDTSFHPAYPAWIGIFYGIGGMRGAQLVNFPWLVIGLLSLYLITKELKTPKAGLVAILLFCTSYPMFWFSRITHNENQLFGVCWLGILIYLWAINKKNIYYFIISLFIFSQAALTRSEGLIIWVPLLISSFYYLVIKKQKWLLDKKLFFLTIFLIPVGYFYLIINNNNFIHNVLLMLGDIFRFSIKPVVTGVKINPSNPLDMYWHLPELTFLMLAQYNLYLPILFIPLGFILSLLNPYKKSLGKLLLIIFIFSPVLLYLRDPQITLDHPWFLRRFFPIFIPLSYLCFSVFIIRVFQNAKYFNILLITFILGINLIISKPLVFFSENKGALEGVKKLAENFTPKDLTLVDRYAANTYKLAEPLYFLYDIPAVWFDLAEFYQFKLNPSDFENIYLIIGKENTRLLEEFPVAELKLIDEVELTRTNLIRTTPIYHFPELLTVKSQFNLDYNLIKNRIKVPSETSVQTYKILVYKIDKNYFETTAGRRFFIQGKYL